MEAFLKETVEGVKFELTIDTNIFSKDIILKTAYVFLDRGYFFFKMDGKNILLQFTKKEEIKDDCMKIIGEFSDELLNNTLRETIFEENKEVRTEIITSAIQNSLREAELPNNWKGYESVEDNYFDNGGSANQGGNNNEIDFDKDIDDILKEIENDPELKIDEEEIEKILREIEEETENEVDEIPQITINPEAVKKAKENFKK